MKWTMRSAERCATIEIDGTAHPVRMRAHPAARSIKLRYDALAGEVRITAPPGMTMRTALKMAEQHCQWLRREIGRAISPIALAPGTRLAVEGHDHVIRWSSDYPRAPLLHEGVIQVGGEQASLESRLLRWLREAARERLASDLAHYCARANHPVPKLAIGDPRTRWGSCSTRSGIRLNWRLVMAPIAVRRSVVAHEVAHLTHMDHSARFYAHLDILFEGNRSSADRWLHENGAGLRALGARKLARSG